MPETMTELRMCAADGCGKSFPRKGKQMTCSEACRKKRHEQQLRDLTKRRQEARPAKVPVKCAECGGEYVKRNWKHKYCAKPECARAGLEKAVARQKVKREIDKQTRRGTNAPTGFDHGGD